MAKRIKPDHRASDFNLEPLESDADFFQWFFLAFLFGKPIQSTVAADTWRVFMNEGLTTPWALAEASDTELVRLLRAGAYTRYQHVMASAIHRCMAQLIAWYDGSLLYAISISENEDAFNQQLQKLYGVGPKTAEIIMRETEEYFAQRTE